MKKLFMTIPATILVLFVFLGVKCVKEDVKPSSGSFTIEVTGDSIMTVTLGETGEFSFKIRNLTDYGDSVTVDVPQGLNELPEQWLWQLCIEGMCLLPGNPATVFVPAKGSYDYLALHIVTYEEGAEGRVTIEVRGIGNDVKWQTFILKITP